MNHSVLPAEEGWLCRPVLRSRTTAEGGRDVGSTLLGRTFTLRRFIVQRQGRARLRRALEPFGRDEYQGSTESRPTEENQFMVPMHAQTRKEATHELSLSR